MAIVSVIIPVYNDEKHVARAIESVLAQTLKEVEIIVVDDGSTDGTLQVLGEYESRIKVLALEHRGVAAARNAGIQASSGEYICFLDSDDTVMPRSMETHVAILSQNLDIGLSYGRYEVVSEETNAVRVCGCVALRDWTDGLSLTWWFAPNAALVRREWVEAVGGFDENLRACVDIDFFWRLRDAGCRFMGINDVVASALTRSSSLTKRDPDKLRNNRLKVLDKYFKAPDADRWPVEARQRAYAQVWVVAGADRLKLGEKEAAVNAWVKALKFDPLAFQRVDNWQHVIRHGDPKFPHRDPSEHWNLGEAWRLALETLQAAARQSSNKIRLDTGSLSVEKGIFSLALAKTAFLSGSGNEARQWLLRGLKSFPRLMLLGQYRRLLMKIVVGKALTGHVQTALERLRGLRDGQDASELTAIEDEKHQLGNNTAQNNAEAD